MIPRPGTTPRPAKTPKIPTLDPHPAVAEPDELRVEFVLTGEALERWRLVLASKDVLLTEPGKKPRPITDEDRHAVALRTFIEQFIKPNDPRVREAQAALQAAAGY